MYFVSTDVATVSSDLGRTSDVRLRDYRFYVMIRVGDSEIVKQRIRFL